MNKPIDPGEGYRLLETGEIIADSDEVFENGAWNNKLALAVGKNITGFHMPFRRKINWIPLSEALPTEFPCEVWHPDWRGIASDCGSVLASNKNGVRASLSLNSFTHWKPLRLSDPPKPEELTEKTAFGQWYELNGAAHLRNEQRQAWLAALDYARAKK